MQNTFINPHYRRGANPDKEGSPMITRFEDSLRGYAYPVMKRDGFICRYCWLDGTESFSNWLCLSWNQLLPKDHPDRDDPAFSVTACMFCNVADNHHSQKAKERGL